MGAARKALWYIESHFAENPSLAQIAEAVELSPFHLSRLFLVSTGTSMARYLRVRRLTEAARILAAGSEPILDVALAAGYASHAAFTNAFSEQFKLPPGTGSPERAARPRIVGGLQARRPTPALRG